MGEHAVTAVVATWPGEDGQPEVHFEVGAPSGLLVQLLSVVCCAAGAHGRQLAACLPSQVLPGSVLLHCTALGLS